MKPAITIAVTEIPQGAMHAYSVDGREIVVCHTKDGIYALDNICSHAYARLNEGRLRGSRLICPLHGASFDVRDGRVLGAPASRPLAVHAIRIVNERIEVSIQSGATATHPPPR